MTSRIAFSASHRRPWRSLQHPSRCGSVAGRTWCGPRPAGTCPRYRDFGITSTRTWVDHALQTGERCHRPGDRPALVIIGRQDDAVGYHDQFDLLKSYPRMTYVALDRAGHNVHLDQPVITRALFADWLRKMS